MMKHKVVTMCVVGLAAGLLLFAGAGLSLSASPPKATGGVGFTTTEDGEEVHHRVEFNAHATDPAKGNLNYRDSRGDWFRVDIQCVTVFADSAMAYFSGPITSASDSTMVGQWLLVGVYDGGSPGSKGDIVWGEMFRYDPGCQPGEDLGGPWPVENGNLVVH
jgi:hypothetical protein